MPQSSTRLRDLPHYRVSAEELAKWLDEQGDESWWSVDGDPILTELVNFPCPASELAAKLRVVGKQLLLLDSDKGSTANGEPIAAQELDGVAFIDQSGDRVFQFCWEVGPDVDWLLVEDRETSESYSGLDEKE